MVMMHPARSSNSNAGIAVISFDLSATLLDPRQDDAHLPMHLQGVRPISLFSVVGTFEGLTINRNYLPQVFQLLTVPISESNAQILLMVVQTLVERYLDRECHSVGLKLF